MTAPAFSCVCIRAAEGDIPIFPWFGGTTAANHFRTFTEAVWVAGLEWTRQKQLILPHYEAHTRGSPHSHISMKRGNDVFRGGLSWDGGGCSCHAVGQNFPPPDEPEQWRGHGLTNPEYIWGSR